MNKTLPTVCQVGKSANLLLTRLTEVYFPTLSGLSLPRNAFNSTYAYKLPRTSISKTMFHLGFDGESI